MLTNHSSWAVTLSTFNSDRRQTRKPTRTLLLAAVGTACCVLPIWAAATSLVTNCNDSGSGSLRDAVKNAPDNGVVDATGLANVCSKITVSTGEITTTANNLTILGPGVDSLDVSALTLITHPPKHFFGRIFHHYGKGTLTIENMTISYGLVTDAQSKGGGCIYSLGNVDLRQTSVVNCKVASSAYKVGGGGVFGYGTVSLTNSQVTGNTLTDQVGTLTNASKLNGGGVYGVNVSVQGSVISGNTVMLESGLAAGGGVYAYEMLNVQASTISNNVVSLGNVASYSKSGSGGGAYAAFGTVTIINSTVSENTAPSSSALSSGANAVTLQNSTFAFNKNVDAGPAVSLYGVESVTLVSNILSNNIVAATGADDDLKIALGPGGTASGSHNLVYASDTGLPTDTLVGTCPLLGPLRDNGGGRPTHALLSHSPALNTGSNPTNQSYDERGVGYPRVLGTATDIGAYEVDPADVIFNTSFEGY